MTANAFMPEALEANRRNELTDVQARNFGALARDRRKSALSSAAFLVAGAVIVGFFASPTAPVASRVLITCACVFFAIFLVARAAGGDPLARDLKQGQVQSVEGAIGKRGPVGGRISNYFLDIGDRTFKVSRGTFADAPDAGLVRSYFLPRSRKIVNLELLPQTAPVREATVESLAETLRASMQWTHRREANEARAELANIRDAFTASTTNAAIPPAPQQRDPRPLGEAIVGAWSNVMMKVIFSADGTVSATLVGTQRKGHWSIDQAGRLRTDITGFEGSADAWVAGNELTIALEGNG